MIIKSFTKVRFEGARHEAFGAKRENQRVASRRVLASAALVLTLCLFVTPQASAEDWPFARNTVQGTGVATSEIGDAPTKLWEYKAEDASFEATAVVADGVAYLGDTEGGLHAIKLADGSVVWKQAIENTGFVVACGLAAERLFSIDYDGVVRSHDRATGEVQWKFATESEVYAPPIVHEDALLITTEGGQLITLDIAAGKENWRFAIDSPLRCAPTVVAGHTLLAGCDGKLHAVNLTTGEETASVGIGGPTGSSAAIRDGRAYFGTEQGELYAVEIVESNGDLTELKVAWTYRDPRRGQGIRTSPAVSKDAVVYGSQGKAIYALNPTDGELLWTKRLRTKVESSPVIAGNRVVAATGRGEVLVLDLKTGDEVWKYEAGGDFVASPALVDGRVLIGNTDGVLYCFE